MQRFAGIAALAVFMAVAAAYWLSAPVSPRRSTETSEQKPGEAKAGKVGIPDGTADADFDFYVLSLSWSPTFCASSGSGRNRDQCGDGKSFGLIVHGLWPQHERGYPETCPTDQPQQVPRSLGLQVMDIMPGMGLIGHEWRKHGTCSGLTMTDYFSVLRQAFDKIRVPDALRQARLESRTSPVALEDAFISANPGLSRSAMAVTCDNQRLDEVRICLSKTLDFRACREVDANACRATQLTIPPRR